MPSSLDGGDAAAVQGPASRQTATASPDRRKPNDNSRRGVETPDQRLAAYMAMLKEAESSPQATSPADASAALAKRAPRLAAALEYAKRGMYIFPVNRRLVDGRKVPAITGWQVASTTDPKQLAKWFGRALPFNLGIDCAKSGIIVFDTDQKEGRDGDANLRALAGEHVADLDNTLVVESPTGSRHYYVKGSAVRSSVSKIADAVDIRSAGGFVVGAGSDFGKGSYRVINRAPVANISVWQNEAIRAASTVREPAQPVVAVELDLPINVERAAEYLATAPASIEGSGGDDNAFRVACRVRDFGVTEETALDLMRGDWNARCAPPWSDDELAAKVANAYSYAQNGAGVSSFQNTIGTDFDVLPDGDADALGAAANDNGDGADAGDWRARIGLLTLEDCAAQAADARPYVIKGVLAKGDFASIFGAPGAGKSLIAPYLAMCIATGKPAFGRRTRKGAVLYIAAEDVAGMKQRMTALRAVHDANPDLFVLPRVSDLRDKGQRKAVAAAIAELRPVAIIIDTMARAFPGVEENEANSMGEVVSICRAMAKSNAAVLLIHHTPKTDSKTPRGSGALNADLDMALHVEKLANGTVAGTLTKNRNGGTEWAPKFRITVHKLGVDSDGDAVTTAYAAELDGEAATRTATDQREQLDWSALNFIAHTPPSEFTNAVLGKALGVTRDSARGLVRKLGAAGWVNKPERGKPIITPAGHAWLEQNGERLFGYEARGDDLAA